jgi:Domain of unknown function (DUF4145)
MDTELNKTVNDIVKVVCISCKNVNRHKVISSVDQSGKEIMEEEYDYWYYWSKNYQIIECQGCGTISFRTESSNSEECNNEDGEPYMTELVYPKRTIDSWNAKDFFNLPYNLRRIYRETIDCYNNENLTLCGAGVRALVEGLCKENNIEGGEIEIKHENGTVTKKRVDSLQGKINGLYEKGVLPKESAEILHEHRYLGNYAIHDLTSPNKDELSLAIEILEHLFDNIYEIPHKANQLKFKRLSKPK